MALRCKIVGYEIRKGEFTPPEEPNKKIAFENVLFHFLTDCNPSVTGVATSMFGVTSFKVPMKDLNKVTGADSPNDLVDKFVEPLWIPKANGGTVLQALIPVK